MPISEWAFPSSNATSNWTDNLYSDLDRTTVYPNTPSVLGQISYAVADTGENQEYNLTFAGSENRTAVSSLNVYVYGKRASGAGEGWILDIDLRANGASAGTGSKEYADSAEWYTFTATGSWTKAQLQSQFSIRLSSTSGFDTGDVYCVAVEVVYAAATDTTIYCDPTSNLNSVWTTNSSGNIDDGTRYPSTPNEADYVEATDADDNETQTWWLTVPSSRVYSKVRFVEVWVYSRSSAVSVDMSTATVGITYGVTSPTALAMSATPYASASWRVYKFKIDALLSAFASTFQVSIKAPTTIAPTDWYRVYGLYAKIEYEDVGKRTVCRPVADNVTLWNRYSYGLVDDPIATGDTNIVMDATAGLLYSAFANKSDDNEEQIWQFGDPGNRAAWTKATQVKVWILHMNATGVEPALTVRVKVGASWTSTQTISPNVNATWSSLTFTGTWTKADFDTAFLVGFLTGTMGTSDKWDVYAALAEVTTDLRQTGGAFV